MFWAEDKDVEKQLVYKLQGRQQIAIQQVQAIIQEFQEWKQNQPIDNANKDDELDEEIEFIGRIQWEILQLCIKLLNHLLQDNEY